MTCLTGMLYLCLCCCYPPMRYRGIIFLSVSCKYSSRLVEAFKPFCFINRPPACNCCKALIVCLLSTFQIVLDCV